MTGPTRPLWCRLRGHSGWYSEVEIEQRGGLRIERPLLVTCSCGRVLYRAPDVRDGSQLSESRPSAGSGSQTP